MKSSLEFITVKIDKMDSNKVIYAIDLPRDLRKYFCRYRFSLSYSGCNVEISRNPSLLLVPAISIVFPLALITKKKIFCKELDYTYYLSLKKLAEVLHKMYPHIPGSLELYTKFKHVKINGDRKGLFYSGGMDSTYLLISHREEKPFLFTVRGTDIPFWNRYLWYRVQNLVIKTRHRFRCRGNIFICFENPLNLDLLSEDFREELRGRAWWEGIQVGVTLPTLITPIAEKLRLNTIYVASDVPCSVPISWSGRREIYETVAFADVRVISDDSHLTRMDKARKIAEFLTSISFKLELRSCTKTRGRTRENLNCSRCEKCIRTILELILAGIDPNSVGFNVNYATFIEDIKQIIKAGDFTPASTFYWLEIFKEARRLHRSESRATSLYSELIVLENLWKKRLKDLKNEQKERALQALVLISRRLYYEYVDIKVRDRVYPLENIFNSVILEILSMTLNKLNNVVSRMVKPRV